MNLTNLVALYKMYLYYGAVVDTIGNNNLVAVGNPTTVVGKFDDAIGNLNGKNYLLAPSAMFPTFGNHEWTIWFWIKRPSPLDRKIAASEGGVIAPFDTNFSMAWLMSDSLAINVSDNGAIATDAGTLPSDNNWHLIVFSYKGDPDDTGIADVKIYVDDKEPTLQRIDETPFQYMGSLPDTRLFVGAGNPGLGFFSTANHSIDLLGIQRAVITPTEIEIIRSYNPKAETDPLILTAAQRSDKVKNEISTETRIRQTSSVHPIDCECGVCLEKRKNRNANENRIKDKLGYYKGDSHG